MKAKVYLDEDVQVRLAQALRLRGHDAVSTHKAGNQGFSDEEQMAYAVREGRVIVTLKWV